MNGQPFVRFTESNHFGRRHAMRAAEQFLKREVEIGFHLQQSRGVTMTMNALASSMINNAMTTDAIIILHHNPLLYARARNR